MTKRLVGLTMVIILMGVGAGLLAETVLLSSGDQGQKTTDTTLPDSDDCSAIPTTTPIEKPSRPATLTNETVLAYLETLERAYKLHRTGSSTQIAIIQTNEPILSRPTESTYIVQLLGSVNRYTCHDGHVAISEGVYEVMYFLNETTVRRSEYGDPRNGTVVA